jgi:hypothetical protein
MGVWYATREDVKSALDDQSSSNVRTDAQVDRAIEDGSRSVERLCHRKFYPWMGTRYFDWPNFDRASVGRLWLNEHELVSLTSITSGGTAITVGNVLLYPTDGPPYSYIELDRSTSASFDSGDTSQRSIALTGVFGFDSVTTPAGVLNEALDASETAVDVSNSYILGVGDLLTIDSEKMVVTGKSTITSGQTLQANMGSAVSANTVSVTNGAAFYSGEVITVGSEQMLVTDVVGNNLTVKRAWGATINAAHTSGDTVYTWRTLTVERGVLGTTAATHDTSTAVSKQVYPGPVRSLVIAEAINTIMQEGAGYARVVGQGDGQRNASGQGLRDKRKDVYSAYGRKARMRSV